MELAVKHDSKIAADFDFWGYKRNEYSLSLDCESLPWMEKMRDRRGPLPGDT